MSDVIKIPLNDFMPQLLSDLTQIYELVQTASREYESISSILTDSENYFGNGKEFIEGAKVSTEAYLNKLQEFYLIAITYLSNVIEEESLLDRKIALILNDFIENNFA